MPTNPFATDPTRRLLNQNSRHRVVRGASARVGLVAAGLSVASLLSLASCDRADQGAAPQPAAPAPAPAETTQAAPSPTQQGNAQSGSQAGSQAGTASDESASAEPIDALPPISLDPPILDFGIVKPSEATQGVVKLINNGPKELEILTVQPSCKCTTLGDDLSGRKIPPGGFVELKAEMKAQSSPGGKRADIKVLIDGYSQVLVIQMKNEVSLPVRVSPSYLNVVEGNPKTGRTVIESIDGKPFTICAVGGKKPNLIGFDPAKDAPRNQYLLDWDFNRDFEPGKAPRYWVIETDRADSPLIDLFVRHETTVKLSPLRFTDYRHTFGRVEQGTNPELTIEISKIPEGQRVVTVASTSSSVKAELVGSEVEGEITRVKVRLVPNPDFTGLLYTGLVFYTNTQQGEIPAWGQIVPKGHAGCLGR